MKRVLLTIVVLIAGTPLFAQQKPTPKPPPEVAVSPIECWWKTDRSAVRVGEHFQLTLTCAVLDTEKVKVAVDESSLGPSALHLVPFEIVAGQRFRDIRNDPRRFFQYQYTLRVLGEDFFGKEVSLPRLQISYRVQNMLNGGSALAGREAQYSLRPVPIRVLSLVPSGTTDIRDAPPDTFGDVDARLFRSNLLMIVASVALALAVLMAVVVAVRATLKRRATTVVKKRVVAPAFVLRAAARELSSVKSDAAQQGWNGELAGRAAAAMRLAGAIELGRPVGQREVERTATPGEGQIAVARALRGRKMMLSAAVTPGSLNGHSTAGAPSDIWSGISQTLKTFTALRYSRPEAANGSGDSTALDAALAEGQDLVRRLRIRSLLRFRRRPTEAAGASVQTWAR